MWDPIPIDGLMGTVKAVAMPTHDALAYVWTDRGISCVFLDKKKKAYRFHGYKFSLGQFDPEKGTFKWPDTEPVIGTCGADDRLYHADTRTEHPSGQRLEPDVKKHRLLIRDAAGGIVQAIDDYPVGSAAWTAAGFSECGRYLVVASPGSVRAFRFAPSGDKGLPAWGRSGGARDQSALLKAVADAPDDDVPRLVYADWLEEHGDPARAEFIRVQCRIAERERTAPVPDDDPDHVRVQDLVEAHGERWIAEVGRVRGVHWNDYRRGFPGVMVFSAVALVRAAKALAAAGPVERVNLAFLRPGDAKAMAGAAVFGRVRELTITNFLDAPEETLLRALLASPHAAGLRVLRVPHTRTADAAAVAVAGCPLPSLEGVSFGGTTGLTEVGALALARSAHLPRLNWFACGTPKFPAAAKRELRKRFPGIDLK